MKMPSCCQWIPAPGSGVNLVFTSYGPGNVLVSHIFVNFLQIFFSTEREFTEEILHSSLTI